MKSFSNIFSIIFTILLIAACHHHDNITVENDANIHTAANNHIYNVNDIPLPKGYKRVMLNDSFALWLRSYPLRSDNVVYLYNHHPAPDQQLHYAVLDLSTGDKDLQQCADAIMRLMAEYYFSKQQFHLISFRGGDGTVYSFKKYVLTNDLPCTHDTLLHFLETVFSYCGTYTIESMTSKKNITTISAGDVLVHAGSPGHAMIVMDAAVNSKGEKIFLLAQGFMPAQDMHIVINLVDDSLSPWYKAEPGKNIITPGWIFNSDECKCFTCNNP